MGFKENLIRLRDEKGFNNKSLSLAAGLNETAVRDIIKRAKNDPRLDVLEKLALALTVPLTLLIGCDGPTSPEENAKNVTLPDGRIVHYLPADDHDGIFDGTIVVAQISKMTPNIFEYSTIGMQNVLYPLDSSGLRGQPFAYDPVDAWNIGTALQGEIPSTCYIIGVARWVSSPCNLQHS